MSKENEGWARNSSRASELDDLDHERDEIGFETFDDFFKNNGGHDFAQDVDNIKSLEKTLENEKNRLAQMEVELLEAKKQRESGQQFVVMKKQSKALMSVMEKMSTVNDKESVSKQEWDMEWQERMATFHKQHRDMEEALKNRHINELKTLQEEMQRHIRRLAADVQKTKGKRVPSPRTLSHLQEENMSRIIALFQKHAQERLLLASKVSKQEELLIRSKNQSLQKLMGDAQAVAGHWYRKFNLPVPEFKRLQITLPPAADSSRKSIHEFDSEKFKVTGDQSQPETRSTNIYTSASSRAATAMRISLPSPRLCEDGTFLTEIDHTEATVTNAAFTGLSSPHATNFSDPAPANSSSFGFERRHSGFASSVAPTGSLAATHPSLAHKVNAREDSAYPRDDRKDTPNMARLSSQKSVQYGDQSTDALPYKAFQEANRYVVESGMQGSQMYPGGAHPATANPFHVPKDEIKPPWNSWKTSFVSQAIAPVYAAQSSKYPSMSAQSGFKKPGLSPYLIPQPSNGKSANKHGSSSARILPRDTVRATKHSQSEMDRSRSVSARLVPQQETSYRSASTLPIINGGSQDFESFQTNLSSNDSKTVFPHLEDHRPKVSEQNAKPESSQAPAKSMNFAKLESWIEDKIKMILSAPNEKKTSLNTDISADVKSVSEAAGQVGNGPRERDGFESFSQRGQAHPTQSETSETKGNGEIGNLLSRLRTTMASEPSQREPASQGKNLLRNGMEKPSTGMRNEGLGFFNPKSRASDTTSREDRFRGQEISQEPIDESTSSAFRAALEEDDADVQREQARKEKEADRRQRLNQLDVDPSLQSSRQVRPAKKVVWNLEDNPAESEPVVDDADDGSDLFRPDTSLTSSTGMSSSRPDTSASSLSGTLPRPDTSDEEQNERGAAEPLNMEKDFFSLVRHNKVKEFEEILVRCKIPIDTRDKNGNTALMIAAQNGHKRLVKLCFHHDANPNTTNHQGNTALHFANSYGYTTVANYLISKGADDTLMNHQGQTCYEKM